jgi:hypothetical protein
MLKPEQNRPEFGALTAGKTHGFLSGGLQMREKGIEDDG